MKLRLNSRYLLFADCAAHGKTAGLQWWVVQLGSHITKFMPIIILPSEEMVARQPRGVRYKYEYKHGARVVFTILNSVRYLWLGRDGYPECMQEAVYFTVASPYVTPANEITPDTYLVSKPWLPRDRKRGFGTYDRWTDKYKITEKEAVICSADSAKRVCAYLLDKSKRRRRNNETQVR